MAIKTFTTGEVLTASDTNTYLANSGLVFIKQVTTTTATSSIDVTSCFSATYDNYLISFQGYTVSSPSISLQCFLLSGTTPTSSGWYGTEFYIVVGGTTQTGQLAANNSGSVFCSGGTATGGLASITEIQSPFLAQHTKLEYRNVATDYFRYGFATHAANTSYDGLRFTPTSGTLANGSVTIHGYRKQ
jgi:hypothetical protein